MNPFQHKTIFLTGGTGFFGKWLLKTLPQSATVTVLSRNPERFLRENPQFHGVRFVTGDIRDFEIPRTRFDYLIHGATASSGPVEDAEMESVITRGTERVLQMNFGKMLYVSSGAVYGPNPPEHVPEDYPGEPVSVYGRGKLAAEKMCLAGGLPVTIARCFAFVGPYLPLDAHFAIGNFIDDCLHGRPVVIKGDGTPRRSYLYARDLAHWLWTLLASGDPGRAYNVGSDRSCSIREVAELVRSVAGSSNAIEILTPPGTGAPSAYVPDISRARHELGLQVTTSLDGAIRETLEFYRR